MSKVNYYFESEEDNTCYELKHFIFNAKREGLDFIKLHTAIVDTELPDLHFCGYKGEQVERCMCKKVNCSDYTSKSGRGVCNYRSQLYFASCGKITFDVNKEYEKLKSQSNE